MIMRILIVQTAFIGDVILITPLIRAVRELYPEAVIDVMVVPSAAKLLENNPHLNEVLSFAKHHNPAAEMLKTVRLLKSRHYDLAISPHSSGRTHLLLRLAKIPLRIGFDRGPAPFLLTAKIKHPSNMHKINKNLALLKMLSPRDFSMQSELFPSAENIDNATRLLSKLGTAKKIAVAPGSIWTTKCWPLEHYTLLTSKLVAMGYAIVLIGGDGDWEKCDRIERVIRNDNPEALLLNLAGKTDLLESAAVIGKCDLMICNDSGALHIANAMQTRVFAFFGPTVTSIGYYPYREGDRVFEISLVCRPCGSHGGHECPRGHHACMQQISVNSVYDAVVTALERQDNPAH